MESVYELVFNGLTLERVRMAMKEGLRAAANSSGVVKITAANYGGKLGPYKVFLEELMTTEDVREGIASFFEKRKPDWKNR